MTARVTGSSVLNPCPPGDDQIAKVIDDHMIARFDDDGCVELFDDRGSLEPSAGQQMLPFVNRGVEPAFLEPHAPLRRGSAALAIHRGERLQRHRPAGADDGGV